MSFILDALKKSEDERQQVTPAGFASVPSSPPESRTPPWLWLLGALLVINAVVLAGFMARGSGSGPSVTPVSGMAGSGTAPLAIEAPEPATTGREQSPAEATPSFADRVAMARSERPAAVDPVSAESAPPAAIDASPSDTQPPDDSPAPQPDAGQPAETFLPTIDELRMQGALSLPDLHIDIHVYSDAPADRFVFINMNKYREADRLGEGPVVREITRDGVVLEHQGNAFVLPRE